MGAVVLNSGHERVGNEKIEAGLDAPENSKDTQEQLAKLRAALNLQESATHQEIIEVLKEDYDTEAIKVLAKALGIDDPFDLIERVNNISPNA